MLIELIARKPLVIGPYKLERGDVLTSEIHDLLPPGRDKVLQDQGWLEARAVDQSAGRIAALEARLEALESRLASHKHGGRPAKEA